MKHFIHNLAHQFCILMMDLKDLTTPYGENDNEPNNYVFDPLMRLGFAVEDMTR